ncbi:MAG TPA: prephenate dehydrogenase/arogenate dehydrogenase family protein [Candidatus Saccharimonadales bacterium]
MKQISIVGFGRFGQTLQRLLKDDFKIVLYDKAEMPGTAKDLQEVYASDTVFYAVPVSEFETVLAAHKQYFRPDQLLIDVLAVKSYPAKIFEKYLHGTQTQAMLTHPMFGPDSSQDGFTDLPIIVNQFLASQASYDFWKNYFQSKGLHVLELSPGEHDKLSANSIGLTHFLGRLLEEYKLAPTPIDTLGAKKLLEIKDQVCNDSWQLFNDLQHYNPYTKKMRLKLGDAYDHIYNKLLPKQIDPEHLTIGIQGGRGSFNEEAIMYWLQHSDIKNYKLKYLYTSENVLAALHGGEIDKGQFAIHNSVGGIVGESVEAMAKYKFVIDEEFAIKIAHALMIRPDAEFEEVTTIMAHPQVFAQCKRTLPEKYPHLELTSGTGDLIDHANVAKQLGEKKLPKHVATMGSKVLAELYGLKIIEDNLQDAQENYTSFLLVSR